MEQNVVVSIFEVESEAYQALTQLKQNAGDEQSMMTQAVLVKKENGVFTKLDGFDTGVVTGNDTLLGGLVGGLFGILGGPLGVLFMGSYGALIGSLLDADDAIGNASLIEQIAGKLADGDVAVIGLALEEDESILDERLGSFKTSIIRFDAAVVAAEVEEAEQMAQEMARQARMELRDEKKAARKEKIAEKRSKLSAEFEEFKLKFKKE